MGLDRKGKYYDKIHFALHAPITVGELTNKTHKKHTILFIQQHFSPTTILIFYSLQLRDFVTSLDA